MTRKERYSYIIKYFEKALPNVSTELEFGSAFQLLVATVLSAQCTDSRVNAVTVDIFRRYPDAPSMASASEDDILEYIHSISYPNAKARHLVELSRQLVERYGGEVPDSMKELLTLPGVGRKTANVMLAVWFGRAAMPVDTHVYRVSHRLGLVPQQADTPEKVEKYLVGNIPQQYLSRAHHWLLLHGRYTCKSQRPQCETCAFDSFCPKLMDNSKLEK